jgi:hypothetical protein
MVTQQALVFPGPKNDHLKPESAGKCAVVIAKRITDTPN